MGQTCSAGFAKVPNENYGNRGQGGGDPRWGNKTEGSGTNSMAGSNECVKIPLLAPNPSQASNSTSSNVFDTTAGRLGFISPVHT